MVIILQRRSELDSATLLAELKAAGAFVAAGRGKLNTEWPRLRRAARQTALREMFTIAKPDLYRFAVWPGCAG